MVSKLLKDEPTLLPPRKVKHSEDVDWYHKIINNCVTQGIIQGESIQEIAKRIAETTGERGEHAAIRNARTAMTAAQNAGRIEAMHEAQALGIKLQKRWLATLDSRTRDSHQHLDGQVQNVDDPFESDYGYIMFPGDPWAEPADVYNCRCTLLYEHPEYPSDIPRRDNINGEVVGDMSYDEWATAKEWEAEKSGLVQRVEKEIGNNAVTGRGIEKQVDYSKAIPISDKKEHIDNDTAVEHEDDNKQVFLTNAQLESKSQKWLEKETAKLAAQWYKTGKSGISFPPNTDYDKVAGMLAADKSKAQLIKDYKALRKRLK
jgi:SPP1 gp7 family putative phage head morphogenesis protein